MIYRLILPEYIAVKNPKLKKVLENKFTPEQLKHYNSIGYNCYYFPNYPKDYNPEKTVDGTMIDAFEWVFVDFDLKHGQYESKEDFISSLAQFSLLPTKIIDSGNGIHVYWKVVDLTPMVYLMLQRRLMRQLKTDEAVCKLAQLMRVPNTINTKNPDDLKTCSIWYECETNIYHSEDFDKALPIITKEDQEYCVNHYNSVHNIDKTVEVNDSLPPKFGKFLTEIKEAKELWILEQEDRSKADYRLGHLMFAYGFTRDEAMSVLVNANKALSRSSNHRITYAKNIVDKIWTYEIEKTNLNLSASVKDILNKYGDNLKGTRFPCWDYIDNTAYGFRLGQVIGLVAGSGVGKTAIALNMFAGFVKNNPDYDHFFIPLEQPVNEIAERWKNMCGENTSLHEKVQLISNYDDSGTFRHLSFTDIKEYILKYQEQTKRKVGAVVIDHIGALKKKGKNGENQDLMDICHSMKSFAVETNTLLIMQSQAPREKAGIGDLELNKDAAYGTVYFESYCDYLITIWQPLKRCHGENGCPTITAFKFCKIRHKKTNIDKIQEDVCYKLFFDSKTETLRDLTQDENTGFAFWLNKATNKRKLNSKTDIITYNSVVTSSNEGLNGNIKNNKNII